MNVTVRCPRCGEEVQAAYRSLRWIRCPTCHYRIPVPDNTVDVEYPLIAPTVEGFREEMDLQALLRRRVRGKKALRLVGRN